MAIENTDLLVAYRPTEQKHYRISIADFPTGDGNPIPNGLNVGDILVWDGNSWEPSFTVDGGSF